MTVERFNLDRLVPTEGHKVVEITELKDVLQAFCFKLANELPPGNEVTIRRIGNTSFDVSIISRITNIVQQQFNVTWHPETKQVTWAAVL